MNRSKAPGREMSQDQHDVPKRRASIPREIRDRVLREYNHRCALCGTDRPQIHHIDEDPANNKVENLLPLCPNHHLSDQHNPTARIPARKLALLRRYKDPSVLSPQFDPIFRRMSFLYDVENAKDMAATAESAHELVRFIKVLQMGPFYGPAIGELIMRPQQPMAWALDTPEEEIRRVRKEQHEHYRKFLLENREKALTLIVELLRYQEWPTQS
jgi:hypothetical protein